MKNNLEVILIVAILLFTFGVSLYYTACLLNSITYQGPNYDMLYM